MPEPEEEETIQPVELGRATKVVESFIDQMFTGFELDTQDKLEEYFQKVELKHNSDPTFNDHVNAVRNELLRSKSGFPDIFTQENLDPAFENATCVLSEAIVMARIYEPEKTHELSAKDIINQYSIANNIRPTYVAHVHETFADYVFHVSNTQPAERTKPQQHDTRNLLRKTHLLQRKQNAA